ncbi:WXG100 family type VII secretion target [Agreia sp. COWG]|uniref:WXG100 family type VII secretion target n=1 Tax=Agreia sp. COWG TaxID=2773266 RepID=UPI0019293FB0|nr:hypothetical protein [Agreia sp. COWG]CAD5992894.1 conserved protein of unknown function [Agreia sp. COWG]
MAVYGADVAQLRALAKQFRRASEELLNSTSTVTTAVNSTAAWRGPDAGQFRSSWNTEQTSKISSAVRALDQASEALVRNAQEQETASTVGTTGSGGSGGSAGSGGSNSPSSGSSPDTGDIDHNVPRPDIAGNTGDLSDPPRHRADDGPRHSAGDPPTRSGYGTSTGAGKWTDEDTDGSYSFGGGQADASSGTTYGPDGAVSHDANSEALWGAGAGTRGSSDDLPLGMSSSGTADAFVGGYTTADAHAGIDENGQANASASAGGFFGGEASAGGRLESGSGSSVGGSVGTMVGVQANAAVGGSIGDHGISANAGVQAMAGASATAAADMDVAGVDLGGSVTGYAGAGVVANADAALTYDDVHLSLDFGVAYGLGLGGGLDVSFSPKDALKSAGIDFDW